MRGDKLKTEFRNLIQRFGQATWERKFGICLHWPENRAQPEIKWTILEGPILQENTFVVENWPARLPPPGFFESVPPEN